MEFEEMEAKALEAFVSETIKEWKSGPAMVQANEQRAYYETDNPDIKKRKKQYAAGVPDEDAPGEFRAIAKENKFAANEKMPSSFFKDITDAKVQYLAGEGADVAALNEADAEAVEALYGPLRRQIRRQGQACLTDALIYRSGFAYLQIINDRPKLTHIDFCEVIPLRNKQNKLENVVRIYKRGKKEFAELHTPATVFYLEENEEKGGEFKLVSTAPQIITIKQYGDGTVTPEGGKAWPRLPWFEMQHNNDKTSSLTCSVKGMIRCYDIVSSDFVNNLIDVQDVFVKLKQGYGSGMEYGETLEMMRIFKAAEDVEGVQTVDVPYQARQVLLDMLTANIYKALRGVDLTQLRGGNKTAKEIKAIYSDIDLWADQAEWHLEDWVLDILETVAAYQETELPEVSVSFTRRVMFDQTEQMDALARQKGIISDKTLLENHPLVVNAQAELEQLNAEELDAAYSNQSGGGFIGFE